MKFTSDKQRRAVFSKFNLFSKGRVPNIGEKVEVKGDESVGMFPWTGVVVRAYDKGALIKDEKDGSVVELGLEEFEDEPSIDAKQKFEGELMAEWVAEKKAEKNIKIIDKLLDDGVLTPVQSAILLKNREKLESGVEFSKTADLLKANMNSEYVARDYVLGKLELNGENDKAGYIKRLIPELEGTDALSREQVIKTLEMDEKPNVGILSGKCAIDKSDFSKHPQEVGTSWEGEDYNHGPRIMQPSRFVFIRTVEPNDKYRSFVGGDKIPKKLPKGAKLVIGKLKGGNEWGVQSMLTPKD